MRGVGHRAGLVLGIGFVSLMLAFIYLPVATLILFAFQSSSVPVPPFDGPSLRWFNAILDDTRMMDALQNSLVVAFASAAVSTSFGALAAYAVNRYAGPRVRQLQGLFLAPLTISYVILAMGLLITFLRVGIPKSLAAVVIGHGVINLPVAYAMVSSQLKREFVSLERAARDLGAREWQVLWHVLLPCLTWPIIVAFLLSFTLSWDEFIIALLVTRFDVTLPVEIWSQLRSGLNPKANAVGALVFLTSSTIVIVSATIIFARGRGRKSK